MEQGVPFHELTPFETTPHTRAMRLRAGCSILADDTLRLYYQISGELSALVIAPPAACARQDNLWQSTCFEIFLREPSAKTYLEINVSPSTQWAAYRFADYRGDAINAPDIPTIETDTHSTPGALTLQSRLTLPPWLSDHRGDLQMNLAAVLEFTDGSKSYWALTHPADRPDFHHAGGFVASPHKE